MRTMRVSVKKYETPLVIPLDEEIERSILTTSGEDLPEWDEVGVNGNDDF